MDYQALLYKHDHPTRLECPFWFSRRLAEKRLEAVHRALADGLDDPVEAESGVQIQDASFHGEIRLGVFDGEIVVIRFSNFGQMVAVSGEDCISGAMLDQIKAIFAEHGYVYVPLGELGAYAGRNRGIDGIESWWDRYFDWA